MDGESKQDLNALLTQIDSTLNETLNVLNTITAQWKSSESAPETQNVKQLDVSALESNLILKPLSRGNSLPLH